MYNNLSFRMIFVMVLITAVSGLVLSGVWSVSVEKIKKNETIRVEEALYSINPQVKSFKVKVKNGESIYECYDKDKILKAYFFLAEGNGFQAPIKVALSVDIDWKNITGIRVLEQSETPGLGAKITEDSFYDKFSSLTLLEKPVVCIKEKAEKTNSEIRAITAATISSQAVVDLINKKIKILRKAGF
ncbi:MAG: FMN-binding protein [bacterium]|nr:FMN-binding protein [bacterium]